MEIEEVAFRESTCSHMTAYGEHTVELDRYLKKTGNGNLIYVQLPFKIENDSRMPAGSFEYGNDNADDLLKQIRAAGVDINL